MVKVESLRAERKFKKTEIGEIPVDWKVLRVKDVCEKPEYGYTASAVEKPLGPKFLRITDIQDGKVIWNNVPYCNCPDNLKERYIIRSGDILFARTGATTGKSYLIKDCPEAVFASCLIRVAVNEQIDSHFLYSVFNSSIYWRQITQQMGGSAQGGVNASSLANIKIPLPPLSEQKKIAEILSTVDEAIEKNNLVIEKTRELKKGLMQELLTHGIGHKKFKKTEIGDIPEEWKVVRLKTVVKEFRNGGTPSTKVKAFWEGNIPWVTGADFINQKIGQIRRHLSMQGVKSSATNIIPKGSLLIVTRTGVGKLAIAPFDIAISQDITGVLTDHTKLSPDFLYWYLNLNEIKLKILLQGTSINGIIREDLANLHICLPPLIEQKEIIRGLFLLDNQIDNETINNQRLANLKEALMQILLTGKVRTIK